MPPPSPGDMRPKPLLLRVGLSLLMVACLCCAVAAAVILGTAKHANSLCFAAAILIASVVLAWWSAAIRSGWRHPRPRIVLAGFALTAALCILADCLSPSGEVSGASRLSSVFRGQDRYRRWSPAWLVDESDQVRLGGILVQYAHPVLRGAPGAHFRRAFDAIYAEMEQSDDFRLIGSSLGETYSDLLLPTRAVGHAYIYRPRSQPTTRSPVIVFLHGLLGNMKAYTWSWTRFAEDHGFVIISPTFRNGIWSGPDAIENIAWLDTVIRSDPSCDPARVVVVALSNGGSGVPHWAEQLPTTFCGLVMVSPVMDGTDTAAFATAVGQRPILVVYGSEDGLIPPVYVGTAVDRMRENRLRAESICYEHEDHALILSSRDRLQADILRWMRANGLVSVVDPPCSDDQTASR